jgi:hypothetical protein
MHPYSVRPMVTAASVLLNYQHWVQLQDPPERGHEQSEAALSSGHNGHMGALSSHQVRVASAHNKIHKARLSTYLNGAFREAGRPRQRPASSQVPLGVLQRVPCPPPRPRRPRVEPRVLRPQPLLVLLACRTETLMGGLKQASRAAVAAAATRLSVMKLATAAASCAS